MIITNPTKIYIKLTKSCNLNCSYCIQHHDYKSDNINYYNDFNDDIIDFLNNNIVRTDNKKSKVLLFGGEPLLKFELIKHITKKTNNSKIQFVIITNGVLLNDEIIKFCNDYNIRFVISWDGTNSAKTRGYDVLKNKNKELLNIDYIEFNSLLTNESVLYDKIYNISDFEKQYFNIHMYPMRISLKNIRKYPYTNDYYKQLNIEINKIAKEYYSYNKYNIIKNWLDPWFIYKPRVSREIYNISDNYKYITIMPDGSIMYSSSIERKISDIYQSEFPKNIYFNERYEECSKCSIKDICYFYLNNPEMIDYQGKNYFCKANKILFEPILELKRKIING